MYNISSRTHRSYSTGGTIALPSHVEFRSTSVYNYNIRPNTQQNCYSTAPMNIANGTVKTIASSIQGGVLSNGVDVAGPQRIHDRRNTMAPPTETPIGDGWDVALLLAILCVSYVVSKYISVRRSNG